MKILNKVTVDGQAIPLEGVPNARQLGGYRTPDQQTVKQGLLLRTGKLTGATPGDIRRLVDGLKLGTVIDLRTTAEIKSGADPAMDGVKNIHLKILDEASEMDFAASVAASFLDSEDPVRAVLALAESSRGITSHTYSDIVFGETAREGYSRFFRILLENTDGRSVLWHCTGGKDRTGLAAALLLSALGMDRMTVLDDFELTNQFLAPDIAYTLQKASACTKDETLLGAVKNIVGVSRAFMEQVLNDIDAGYGSVDNFLRDFLGLSDREKARLRELYLEEENRL